MHPDNHEQVADGLSLDACLELLANRQRRVILGYLLEAETGTATIDELVAEIAEAEARVTGERPGHDTIGATLFHVHLPKFASAGVLEYDPRNLDVHYRGDPELEELFRMIQERR